MTQTAVMPGVEQENSLTISFLTDQIISESSWHSKVAINEGSNSVPNSFPINSDAAISMAKSSEIDS